MGDSGTENIRETLKKAREALFKAEAPSAHYQVRADQTRGPCLVANRTPSRKSGRPPPGMWPIRVNVPQRLNQRSSDAPSAHYQGSISVIKDDLPPNGAKLRSYRKRVSI